MNEDFKRLAMPDGKTKYLFFGGKGGVGKTTLAATTAVWFADRGYETTIVSTDPTVSLSAMFDQRVGGDAAVPIRQVPRLRGLNINPADAKGVFKKRLDGLMGQIEESLGPDGVSTPCAEEMAAFDQFVSYLEKPEGEVVVFDTAPTGKSLRELAMPFDWAGFMQRQIEEGQRFAGAMGLDSSSLEELERDKRRYDAALAVLRDRANSVFTLVLLPEKIPIAETQSAVSGLGHLGIPVQALVINQSILPEVVEGNRFLAARARLQAKYRDEIERRFSGFVRTALPLLDRDVSDLPALRLVGELLLGA